MPYNLEGRVKLGQAKSRGLCLASLLLRSAVPNPDVAFFLTEVNCYRAVRVSDRFVKLTKVRFWGGESGR